MSTSFRTFRRGRLSWLELELLRRKDVRHGFTARYGGASRGSFASLNFTSRQGDDPGRVQENWGRLEAAAGLSPGRWALVSQVHGAKVVEAFSGKKACPHRQGCPPADALVTTSDRMTLGVLTADCLAAVLVSADGRAVAVAHAGWRGTLDGILREALETMTENDTAEVSAGLGPCIGSCCYEVGEEIRQAFSEKWGGDFVKKVFRRQGGWRLDLQKANVIHLLEAGVRRSNIAAVPLCTSCRKDLFFSHRRDGERTGRMLTFAGLKR